MDLSQLFVGSGKGLKPFNDFFDGCVLSARLVHNHFEELLVLLHCVLLSFDSLGFVLQNLTLHNFRLDLLLLRLVILLVFKNILVGLLHGLLVSIQIVGKRY